MSALLVQTFQGIPDIIVAFERLVQEHAYFSYLGSFNMLLLFDFFSHLSHKANKVSF